MLPALYELRRSALEAWIERAITLLDELDGDENLEPELAGFDSRNMDDREGDDEREWDLAGATTDLEYDEGYFGY